MQIQILIELEEFQQDGAHKKILVMISNPFLNLIPGLEPTFYVQIFLKQKLINYQMMVME